MRVLVTGGRTYIAYRTIRDVLATYDTAPPPTLVHGDAPGADTAAAQVAEFVFDWEMEPHPAEWPTCRSDCPRGHRRRDRFGRWYCPWAGRRRNQAMADAGADILIAFPGGKGTADMTRRAQAAGIPVHHVEHTTKGN